MNAWIVCVSGFRPVGFDSREKAYDYAVDMLFKNCFGDVWEERHAKRQLDESYAKNNGQFGYHIDAINSNVIVYEVEVK